MKMTKQIFVIKRTVDEIVSKWKTSDVYRIRKMKGKKAKQGTTENSMRAMKMKKKIVKVESSAGNGNGNQRR